MWLLWRFEPPLLGLFPMLVIFEALLSNPFGHLTLTRSTTALQLLNIYQTSPNIYVPSCPPILYSLSSFFLLWYPSPNVYPSPLVLLSLFFSISYSSSYTHNPPCPQSLLPILFIPSSSLTCPPLQTFPPLSSSSYFLFCFCYHCFPFFTIINFVPSHFFWSFTACSSIFSSYLLLIPLKCPFFSPSLPSSLYLCSSYYP